MSEVTELKNSLIGSVLSFLFFSSFVTLMTIKVNGKFKELSEQIQRGPEFYALQVEEVYYLDGIEESFSLKWEDYPHADKFAAVRDSSNFMQLYHHPELLGFGTPFRGVPDTFYLTIVKI